LPTTIRAAGCIAVPASPVATSQTALTVLTDGEEGIRGLVRTFLDGELERFTGLRRLAA
jgi:hypothetical protein